MATLDFTNEEVSTLIEVLESDISDLRVEIVRTEKREFREMLKHKEEILKKILSIFEQGSEI